MIPRLRELQPKFNKVASASLICSISLALATPSLRMNRSFAAALTWSTTATVGRLLLRMAMSNGNSV
jgi:hypothetical protein